MQQDHGILGRQKQHSPPTATFSFPQQSVVFILTQFSVFQALISTIAQGPSTCKTELLCQLLTLSTDSLAFVFVGLFGWFFLMARFESLCLHLLA